MEYYAHSANSKGQWEPLERHLRKTAVLAERYAAAFDEGCAGKWLGLFHDAGKASAMFQGVLQKTEHNVNHAAAGAALLRKHKQLSRVIYAHHDGLLWDIQDDINDSQHIVDSQDHQNGKRFAVTGKDQYQALTKYILGLLDDPKECPQLHIDGESFYGHLPPMLHTRMLLSCLVDADYLATASHEDEFLYKTEESEPLQAERIMEKLTNYRAAIAENSTADPHINQLREQVYAACLQAALCEPGMFTLTAPTGTGKTLALIGFAAQHALQHHKKRIIIVLPFLSIISQNAQIYREICGNVLEAHSMASYSEEESLRLMAERWDAPVIITTSVKFFEAFFKSKPSDLRFLHSIADSVIVFDEAQSIPENLVGCTIETLRMLCEMFRCTVLLSTATQPEFNVRKDIRYQPHEIIPTPSELYAQTRRVTVQWDIAEQTSLLVIAAQMAVHTSVCCVLNRKDHTQKLFCLLREQCEPSEVFHISTDMCKSHRDAVIEEVRQRLRYQLPCRVVSTSCIEAGVDLDFACMYRALAPLDSIVQCAGRCNRNGNTEGKMTIFVPDEEKLYPTPTISNAANKVKLLRANHPIDIYDPAHIKEYYTLLFSDANYDHDKPELQKAINDYDFAEVEQQYRIIPQAGVNALVPYMGEQILFEQLREEAIQKGISKEWMRRAAPITVSSYMEDKLREVAEQCFTMIKGKRIIVPGWYILCTDTCYDPAAGLHLTNESSLNYLL